MLWIKAMHIIWMVAWFSGLFYLPRLFVYHASAQDTISLNRFTIMERRLYYIIATPAGLLTTFFGYWLLIYNPDLYLKARWMHVKLFFVGLLWLYHLYCGHLIRRLAQKQNRYSPTFYRWFNEFPTVVLFVVVILAVVQP